MDTGTAVGVMEAPAMTEPQPTTGPVSVERCDRCNSRALVITETASGLPLSWCKHHFEAIVTPDSGLTVVSDDRASLMPNRSKALGKVGA